MIASALGLLLLVQSGPNPAAGAMTGVPEELRNRPARVEAAPALPQGRPAQRLSQCLALAESDPLAALDRAQAWREGAQDQLDLAQTSHCLGMALTLLGRFDEARTALDMASEEAPIEEPAYRARLAAMAGNAALAEGRADLALPLLAGAVEHARPAGDRVLLASVLSDEARALVALDRGAEAADLLTQARDTDPESSEAWLLSATLARRMERLSEAQSAIERAALLAPRDPRVGLEAGVIAALAGRDEAARASFAAVVALAPESAEAATARDYLTQLGSQP